MDKMDITLALKKGTLVHHKEDIEYYRFKTGFRSINRGRVLTKNKTIDGFPHIPRIFAIEKGIERNFTEDTLYLEEKVDGFNLRVGIVENEIFAFSRGGFVDLFSTEKVGEMKLEKFFRDYPNYVLCGEMIGNTPYTRPTKKFDVKFLVFDIDNGKGDYLPVDEKYKVLDKFGIESIPRLGKFNKKEINKIKQVILRIDKSRKEGVVIKSASRKEIVKYVVPTVGIEHIEEAMDAFFDMPPGFFMQRIFRSAVSIEEFDLDRKEYEKQLGRSFLELIDQIKQVKNDGYVYAEFEILIRDNRIFENIIKHMSKEIKIEKIFEKEEGQRKRIRFRKIYKETSKKILDAIRGKAQID